ncbi:ion transporter [Xylanimonas oleitrophica]|uniref:Ion transporter n=1 Tax=Xylanimonas oleitrophica TaxID=2607479 RepID=A0A2W5WR73_9MICO|nr:ion transporter [Xylanimonas oleitrophica]PZR53402.1 ion transporter [Xylanimonas oleitrophica]
MPEPAPARDLPPAPAAGPGGASWRSRLGDWVESTQVQRVVITVILVNAVVLGLETSAGLMAAAGGVLRTIDTVCLAVFVVEIALKLVAHGLRFFRSSWNVFDFLVVSVALAPAGAGFAVLRALRVLRVLRIVSVVPQLRKVVGALLAAVPGIVSIGALLMLVFYVGGVMATTLFGPGLPEYFGTLGASLFTLFQIMTLDSWTSVARPVMEQQPWAWAFFVPFILASAFTVLNLFIAVIVDAMNAMQAVPPPATGAEAGPGKAVKGAAEPGAGAHEDDGVDRTRSHGLPAGAPAAAADVAALHEEIRALRGEVAELSEALRR